MDNTNLITAFIQARMSSSRFPGKVLTPFLGRPLISHVIDAVQTVHLIDQTVVVTSDEPSDDPLVDYLDSIGCDVFRGPLDDVFGRFLAAMKRFPSDWVLRLCADSPLLSPNVLNEVCRHAMPDANWDIVTTRFAPKYPKGQNAELIRADAMKSIDAEHLTDHDREHVTPWFYRHRDQYRIANARGVTIDLAGGDYTVDTPDDLVRLEAMRSSTGNPSQTDEAT
ncbi:3-deoxy-manno-octulosonate cytidylyltransferase [Stieleria maiorica]|uniref:3-deoxy-manno-octulosonate cytidylyltransferase n=1 Tax=Stieleria maiorica TaxID=2795974 RepID=A0A5B9MEF0_9BACT|nr:NTP transferase domain-containing protein [Stieleria maiorica]QEF99642.1 3-deoxy-manno-octulosonate cytidylyltransferase [Stieleria maiorica]